MDLSGKWSFKEDFAYGTDRGVVELNQYGDRLTGVLEFTETIEDESPFKVRCQLEGTVEGSQVEFHVASFKVIEALAPVDYYPESREGMVNANGQIVGSSEDEQGICGVFVMDRL